MADGRYTAQERLYLNSKDEVVKEGDEGFGDRVSLLAGKGQTIPMATAIRYGLATPGSDGEAGSVVGSAVLGVTSEAATTTESNPMMDPANAAKPIEQGDNVVSVQIVDGKPTAADTAEADAEPAGKAVKGPPANKSIEGPAETK